MSKSSQRSTIESHTEYVRGRIRCPGCGERVPRDGIGADGTHCVRCSGTR
ncbi:hypothetical protein [Haloplanus halobius]|nr:hypothetical protein [Haloplanus sp. XH21]